MELNRHFTKVYTVERKPLSWRAFDAFFAEIDRSLISDVAFLLSGERTNETGTSPTDVTQKESK